MLKTDKKKNYLVYIIAAVAATGGLLFGFDTGVISGALLFIKEDWALSSVSQGLVVSSVLIGAVLGAAFSGKIADIFGRRNIIIVTAMIFFFGSLGSALAPDEYWLIFTRIIIGVAIGIASFTVPLYISEISPSKIRGALVSLNQLAITMGIVFSYLVDGALAEVTHGWRFMFAVGIIPAIILAIGMWYLPKTPRWLMSKNREDEARKVLSTLEAEENVEPQIQQMKRNLLEEEKSKGALSELMMPWLRPALIIGIGLMFFQQMTGINTVIYYAPTIFQKAGFVSDASAIYATVGVGLINVIFTVVSIKLIDRLGRKPLLSGGLIGMIISLVALGLAFQFEASLGDALKWVTVGSLVVYIASFAISLGPIAWLIISEIYPLKIRGVAMSIATLSNWAFNFVVALTFLPLLDALGPPTTFWLYAVLGVCGWFFCRFYMPETKGRTLEEIETHWQEGKHPCKL